MSLRLGACLLFAMILAACGEGDARVQQLEEVVRDHDRRQQRFEARVAESLDELASRVDAMVVGLAASAGVEVPSPKPSTTEPSRPVDVGRDEAPRALRANEIAALVAARHRPWMWAVVAAAGAAAFVLGLRWLRRFPRQRGEPGGATWSEAAVLAGAVGPGDASRPTSPRDVAPEFVLDDEVFVLDPGDDLALAAAAERALADEANDDDAETPVPIPRPVAPETSKPGPEVPREPPRWSFQLEASDPVLARAAIAAYLRHDPRVLQRPAPVVRDHPSGLAVECALLPGLVAGEREHLRATLQRLVALR